MKISKNEKPLNHKICQFCKKEFSRESTLVNHSCEKRRRWQQRDDRVVKVGFYVFQKFYEINFKAREGKKKTFEQFIDSPFYSSFVGFGKYLRDIAVVDQDEFIQYIIKNNLKQKDWTNSSIYKEWIKDYVKKEPPLRAFERAVVLMNSWACESQDRWFNFFRNVNSHQAVNHIIFGHISPWIIYTQPATQLLNRFNNNQIEEIKDIIDPTYWDVKLENNMAEIKQIVSWCEEFGI